ncbi:hypothetical protein GXM_03932 [Nostoc sphaeroides CCNUC1]|uniref:Uncharacterized protein n=1 Tax=Nostoc sphaeroides CCNUC1 TaxID=2653204 RepID=A0A5P8W1H7_9NOSO|nr:hypothetical protein GXM_03932 [Nostoc sphaeroides CCNUC1]
MCSWHICLWILGMGHWAWGIGYSPCPVVHSIANLTDLWGHSSH